MVEKYAFEMSVPVQEKRAPRRETAKLEGREWRELDVFERLAYCFPSPAFIRLPQVRNGTGFTQKIRTADCLVASVYPSRGVWLGGVEIKCTRTDWKKELREPEKSEDIQRYCRFWWVACPSGVVPEGELPESWGLIEVRADGAKITKPAVKQEEEQPDLLFLLSVLRTTSQIMVPIEEMNRRIEEAKAAAPPQEPMEWQPDPAKVAAVLSKFKKAGNVARQIESLSSDMTTELEILRGRDGLEV